MAKALAFKRLTNEVVTIDTVNNDLVALGAAIPSVDVSPAFPLRTRNNLIIFQGSPFLLYRDTPGLDARLSAFDGTVWADPGFALGTGADVPGGMFLDRDQLVTHWYDGANVRFARSTDGATWPGSVTSPAVTDQGQSVLWRNTVFVATPEGLVYYLPQTNVAGAAVDTGDDAGMTGPEMVLGSFAFWNNDLYFMLPGPSLRLYKLDASWQPGAPVAPPAWTNQVALGIPSLGTFAVGPDAGAPCLFVNALDELCLLYSAQLGTKLAKTTAATFPQFTDETGNFLPTALAARTDVGFALAQDDRRRVGELQSFILHLTSGDTQLASWDGVNEVNVRTTFVGDAVMPPNDRFGALRIYTAFQPSTHIDPAGVTQPFPGRVEIDYTLKEASSRPCDIFGEYSTDGDEWLPMSQGDGDDGNELLTASPAGVSHTFFWDAWQDVSGTFDNMNMRIVARISAV